ncbi:MAG: hypothetical protein R2910_05515 [Gemmatimonadales bacterium]
MAEAGNAALREAARWRRIPEEARCAVCGTNNRVVLTAWGDDWRCYQCGSWAHRRSVMEAHHIFSRKVSPVTIDIAANLHRELSDQQLAIPQDILKAAPENPVAYILMILYSVRDFAKTIVGYLDRVIQWLRQHLAWLTQMHGPEWYKQHAPLFAAALP